MLTKTASRGSMSGSSQVGSPVEDRTAPPTAPLVSYGSMGSMASIGSLGSVGSTAPMTVGDVTASDSHHQLQRRDSQGILISFARALDINKSSAFLLSERIQTIELSY